MAIFFSHNTNEHWDGISWLCKKKTIPKSNSRLTLAYSQFYFGIVSHGIFKFWHKKEKIKKETSLIPDSASKSNMRRTPTEKRRHSGKSYLTSRISCVVFISTRFGDKVGRKKGKRFLEKN